MTEPLPPDAADLADDAKRLLTELDEAIPGARAVSGECRPAVDVLETAETVEVVVDLPGVPHAAMRVAIRRNTVLVVGVKLNAPVEGLLRFHLAERSYGRFARVVRLSGAFDASRARATAAGGQLRVELPRVRDRRGLLIAVPVEPGMTRLLFIGDIVGRPGRELIRRGLAALVAHHQIDLVIANGENAAAGFGITPDLADDLFSYGINVMTGGNHTWDKREILPYFAHQPRLLRPANMPPGAPGRGRFVARAGNGVAVGVINLMGRVFMTAIDDPFRQATEEVNALRGEASVIFVDFHAEATSEKVAMGWHLDGRVAAVVGTHTHVQTADERVLPQGTAYITDVGMTGPHDSVIGVERSAILQRFLTALPQRFETASENPRLNGVVITADETTGRATAIDRVSLSAQQIEVLVAQPSAAR